MCRLNKHHKALQEVNARQSLLPCTPSKVPRRQVSPLSILSGAHLVRSPFCRPEEGDPTPKLPSLPSPILWLLKKKTKEILLQKLSLMWSSGCRFFSSLLLAHHLPQWCPFLLWPLSTAVLNGINDHDQ